MKLIILGYYLKYGQCLKTCCERTIRVEKGESEVFFISKNKTNNK